MMNRSPRAYLAGPTVFFPDALSRGEALVAICSAQGIEGIFPPVFPATSGPDRRQAALKIFSLNVKLLSSCDLLIADLSPFRGPHADDGTAFEVGMAYGL